MSIKKCLIFGGSLLLLIGSATLNGAGPPGFLEGHLKVVSPKTVDLADGNVSTVTSETYAEYPLIILSRHEKKEIARVTADKNGNYRVALPPGDYLLDVEGRGRGHARAKAQAFTVTSKQTVRADIDLDTGVR
jgi:hypothetical protein